MAITLSFHTTCLNELHALLFVNNFLPKLLTSRRGKWTPTELSDCRGYTKLDPGLGTNSILDLEEGNRITLLEPEPHSE
jgi:hypothetical protein